MTLGDSCSLEQPPPPPVDFSCQLPPPPSQSTDLASNHTIITSAPGTPTAFQPPAQQNHQQNIGLNQPIFNPALMAAQLGVFNNPHLMAMMQSNRNPLLPPPSVVGSPIMPNILQQLSAIRNAQISNANAMNGLHRISSPKMGGNSDRSENCGELCVVCGDKASGRHYGAVSCEGCKGFFKRSIRKQIGYICRSSKDCPVTKFHRNRCQYCRLRKCLAMGMRSESVQAERRPVNNSNSDSPPNLNSTPRALTPLNAGLVNGLLSLVKMEQDKIPSSAASTISTTATLDQIMKQEHNSRACSPSNEFVDVKRDSIGEDESALDTMTVIGLVPSASPTSSGVGSSSSLSDDTGPIFNAERSRFEIPIPSSPPTHFNNQYISETASRLLFLSVHWIKDARITLRHSTLESVLKLKWCDIFILGLMQTSETIKLVTMLENMSNHLAVAVEMGHLSTDKFEKVNEQMQKLIQLSKMFEAHQLSAIEFAYLKLISFTSEDLPNINSTSETRQANLSASNELFEHVSSSKNIAHIEHINVDDSTSEDNETHITSQQNHNQMIAVERFSRLLQLLPCLRWFDASIIVELFFSGLLGQMSIETVIPFVLQMNVMNFFDSSSSAPTDAMSTTTSICDILSNQ